MVNNEFVFGNFPQQVKHTLNQLMTGLQNQDTYIFEDQDFIITQHSQISQFVKKDMVGNDDITLHLLRSYNMISLLHSKKTKDCSQY
jgi:hypothetical protein